MLYLKLDALPVGVRVAEWIGGERRTATFKGRNEEKGPTLSAFPDMWIEWDPYWAPRGGDPRQRLDLLRLGKPFLMNLLSFPNVAPELYERELNAGSKVEIETKNGEQLKVTLVQPISFFKLLVSVSSANYLVCADEQGQSIIVRREQLTSLWAEVLLVEQCGSAACKRLAKLATWHPTLRQALIVNTFHERLNPSPRFLAGRVTATDGGFLLDTHNFSTFYTREHLATTWVLLNESIQVGEERRGPVWIDVSKPGASHPNLVEAIFVARSAERILFELADVDSVRHSTEMFPNPEGIYTDLLRAP
jgi:hypothetical protein